MAQHLDLGAYGSWVRCIGSVDRVLKYQIALELPRGELGCCVDWL